MDNKFEDSKYQKSVYQFVSESDDNLLINAVAGSGKTTTIIKSTTFLPKFKDVNFIAFNKSIADNLKGKLGRGIDSSTIHSFGFSSLLRSYGKMKVEEKKVINILYQNTKRFGITKDKEKSFIFNIAKLVDFIRLNNCEDDMTKIQNLVEKHSLLVTEDDILKALEILSIANSKDDSIDYVDMIYRPVRRDLKVKKYDIVFVDESQDLSIIQQDLLARMIKHTGRFIAVGDPHQSIYGFAGADIESFDKLKSKPRTEELPLSVCYRCGKSIVRYAKEIVPQIEAFDGAGPGLVSNGSHKSIKLGDWVLCRNSKPIFVMALMKFKAKIPVTIKGYDLGNDLLELLRKCDHNNKIVAKVKLNSILDKWFDKLFSFGVENPEKANSYIELLEKIEIITEIIFPSVNDVNGAKDLISELFKERKEDQRITFSTIHKAKGFEANNVFVLMRELIPSRFAKTDWELRQERNLEYVCYTRAREKLIFVDDFSV